MTVHIHNNSLFKASRTATKESFVILTRQTLFGGYVHVPEFTRRKDKLLKRSWSSQLRDIIWNVYNLRECALWNYAFCRPGRSLWSKLTSWVSVVPRMWRKKTKNDSLELAVGLRWRRNCPHFWRYLNPSLHIPQEWGPDRIAAVDTDAGVHIILYCVDSCGNNGLIVGKWLLKPDYQ